MPSPEREAKAEVKEEVRCVVREIDEGELELVERALPTGSSPHHRTRFEKHGSGEATYLIAWLGENPVGHLLLKWEGAANDEVKRQLRGCPEINALGVAPSLQSKGIGTQLISAAEERVLQRGYQQVGLAAGIENPRARQLYERLGYEDWGHGEFETSWLETDRDGHQTRVKERCTYFVKKLEPSDGQS